MLWLTRPLVCDGVIVRDGLDPARLNDVDLPGISLRMQVILDTIEMPRCEGRLIPVRIFDRMDTLESLILHGGHPRLSDWSDLVREFGEYYGLAEVSSIAVDRESYREVSQRYAQAMAAPVTPRERPARLPRIRMDFNGSSLANHSTQEDLRRQGIELRPGMRGVFYDFDGDEQGNPGLLHVEGEVYWDERTGVFRLSSSAEYRFTLGTDPSVLDALYP